jgi:signal transduction histidine kinase
LHAAIKALNGVRVLVADNRSGIKRKYLQRVVEPFFITKGVEGSGLGLAIVQEIVQEQRGLLRVRSSDRRGNSGTVFSIFLPLSPLIAQQ